MIGIDVSEHNGKLDWGKIKASGVKFAIIRTGYGTSHEDTYFRANMDGALMYGIPVGVYHFSYALNSDGAGKEAKYVLSLLKPYKNKIFLPVFFDFEYDTVSYAQKQGVTLGKQAFNDHAVAFCETIRQEGYTPGVYYNLDYKTRYVDKSRLSGYVQWFAQYNNTPDWTGYDLWQYSSTYTIQGIASTFDANIASEKFEKMLAQGAEEKLSEGTDYIEEDEMQTRYVKVSDVPGDYRDTVDKLVSRGIIKGKEGTGEELVLDLGEDAVRLLVYLDRAGVFG